MKRMIVCLLLLASAQVQAQAPKPDVPVYRQLKPLHLNTPLSQLEIVAPAYAAAEARSLRDAIKKRTGVTVRILEAASQQPAFPFKKHLLLLGNRSDNPVVGGLYDRGFTWIDLKYPGRGGYVVRSLHNPAGDGYNVLFAGGSDEAGVREAARVLAGKIAGGTGGDLSYVCDIRLSEGYKLPETPREIGIWEASERWKSSGYFGWNIVSKYMGLFYMTGKEQYLREFLRYAFPDDAAKKVIDQFDGELIENKNDPLAGPYHYAAHMMILLWDLIEETPMLDDSTRLRVTNAFARQLPHRIVEPVYYATEIPGSWGHRHDDWSAVSLYVLGRYFQRDYPSPVWEHCVRSADRYFLSLPRTYWTAGVNDHLFWFTSFYNPVLDYMLLSGHREPAILANVAKGLNTQRIISNGLPDDWGVRASALNMLNKAAYVLNDGQWLYYRERIKQDTNTFRLGQSFWPAAPLKAVAPAGQAGAWNIQQMAPGMYASRKTGFTPEQSFRWGAYRSELGAGGDYVLIKGYNGAGRNPYHAYALLELRIAGKTILSGYNNQVLTDADGLMEPKVAMDAALLHRTVTGDMVSTVVQVPDLAYADWKRYLMLRSGKYALIADAVRFRRNSEHFRITTEWDTRYPGSVHSTLPLKKSGAFYRQIWTGPSQKDSTKTFFHLIGDGVSSRQISNNAAWLQLPEKALAVSGRFAGNEAALMLLSDNYLMGQDVRKAGGILQADAPVELDWDFQEGQVNLRLSQATQLRLRLRKAPQSRMQLQDGWYAVKLQPGAHTLKGVFPAAPGWPAELPPASLQPALTATSHSGHGGPSAGTNTAAEETLQPVLNARAGDSTIVSEILPAQDGTGQWLAVSAKNEVRLLSPDGNVVRTLPVAAAVRALRWWPEAGLLLVGCADEKVLAYDRNGRLRWSYTSVMDPAVYEAGKQYWFKGAYPGVYGLFSGIFDNGQPRAFVGSACTVEVLDTLGRVVKSIPVFWGNACKFLMARNADGSPDLLVARWMTDRVNLAVIGSRSLVVDRFGYDKVPEGHTFVDGWMNMSRLDNYLTDLDGDGRREIVSAINGSWNRISVYTEDGHPVDNVSVGPGTIEPRTNISMMDIGDINGDGRPEIVAALASGLVDVLNGQTRELIWSRQFDNIPVVVKAVRKDLLWIGTEDGSIFAFDGAGKIRRSGKVQGRPTEIKVLESPRGQLAVVTTDAGSITGFGMDNF
ncbi:FG-GAP-like repeat-containing protein [Chitinophaga lutea]